MNQSDLIDAKIKHLKGQANKLRDNFLTTKISLSR